ncbi:MAG: metallopeptidase family protein [Erythrobacter sp.]
MREHIGPPPSEFERLARVALAGMPDHLPAELADVVLRVEEFASREQLASVGIASRWELTGLYEGRPLTERTIWESGEMPPMISLFRQPLLAEMFETGVELAELVHHVVVHEAGHHFGFSDDDMDAIEDAAGY